MYQSSSAWVQQMWRENITVTGDMPVSDNLNVETRSGSAHVKGAKCE